MITNKKRTNRKFDFFKGSFKIAQLNKSRIMVTQVNQGIKISVDVEFQDYFSNPAEDHFLFAYHIFIENQLDEPVQLLRRRWEISDSNADLRIVEGEGVVGDTPVIGPGETYEYESSCNLASELGKMVGEYTMIKVNSGEKFQVSIPEFVLASPVRLN